MNKNSTIIIRQKNGIGIDSKLHGYDMETGEELRRAVYHGRIVYLKKGKQIGLPTLKKKENKCSIIIKQQIFQLPF